MGITLRPNAVKKWIPPQPELSAMTHLWEQYAGYHQEAHDRKDLDETRGLEGSRRSRCSESD